MSLPTPPSLPGEPILGHVREFLRDPVSVVQRGYDTLGPIFSVRLGPKRAVVLVGPELNRFFFTQPDDVLSVREVYRFLVPMFGEIGPPAAPDVYEEQRRAFAMPAFRSDRIAGYVEAMVEETEAWLDGLGAAGELELWSAMEQVTMRVSASAVLGRDLRRTMGDEFWAFYRDVAAGLEYILPPWLPLRRFRRRDRGRKGLLALLRPVIAERRAHPGAHEDVLQVLVDAVGDDGLPFSEETVVGIVMGFVFGGYETTRTQLFWALSALLRHPAEVALVLDEQERVLPPGRGDLDPQRLGTLTVLGAVLHESFRVHPITPLLMRHNASGYELGGYRVPQGWLTMVSPPVSHHLADVFPQPDVFDPGRFLRDGNAGSHHAFRLINFGGGPHRCLGARFAELQMKVVVTLLLRSYELEPIEPEMPAKDYSAGLVQPQGACMVRYRRRAPIAARASSHAADRPDDRTPA